METSATADGFYFSVRSTRPVLLRRVRVQLLDGTAPTTVRVAVRRDGAAKRLQAARADWALWAAVGRATVESADCVVDLALPVPVAPHSDLCVHASGRPCATTPSLAASPSTGVEICDCSAYSGAAPFFVEGGALVGGALCGGVDVDDCDEAAAARAAGAIERAVSALDDLMPAIGPVNRALLREFQFVGPPPRQECVWDEV